MPACGCNATISLVLWFDSRVRTFLERGFVSGLDIDSLGDDLDDIVAARRLDERIRRGSRPNQQRMRPTDVREGSQVPLGHFMAW